MLTILNLTTKFLEPHDDLEEMEIPTPNEVRTWCFSSIRLNGATDCKDTMREMINNTKRNIDKILR